MDKYYKVTGLDPRHAQRVIQTTIPKEVLDDVAREFGLYVEPADEPFRFSTSEQDPGKRLQFVRNIFEYLYGCRDAAEDAIVKAVQEACDEGAALATQADAGTKVYESLGVAALVHIQTETLGAVRPLEENIARWHSLSAAERKSALLQAQQITLAKGRKQP